MNNDRKADLWLAALAYLLVAALIVSVAAATASGHLEPLVGSVIGLFLFAPPLFWEWRSDRERQRR